ncbi:MAG: EAL domain-containing protein [Planctomycetaceae bacterium]|nr:EAL domain-containing protein [Planctomycetaceae bacterium]
MTALRRELAQSVWFLSGQVDETGPVRCIPVHTMPFLIGRRSDLALQLPRPTVSTVHAELCEQGGTLILRDLKSTNGTYVNGRRVVTDVELAEDDLVQFADVAFRLRRQAARVSHNSTVCEDVVDRAIALVQFDKLMRDRLVIPFFQPIVDMRTQTALAHEVLGRSNLFGLESPGAMFQAASRLNLEVELSRMMRWEAVAVGGSVPQLSHLYVNTHPAELGEPGLIQSLEAIRAVNSTVALTLEIHESAVTNIQSMREIRRELTKLNIGLAFDDFGAGQARLVELVEVSPDVVKFDMGLIRNIDQATSQRQQVLGMLVKMARDVGSIALAEGVETVGEHQVCVELGFELGQGYLYGRPAPCSLYQNALTPTT